MEDSFVLVKVSGPDRPGITFSLMDILKEGPVEIADMGQSVTQGLLSLSILLKVPSSVQSPILKDLLFKAKEMGMNLDFELLDDVRLQNRNRQTFIVSCVSNSMIGPSFIGALAKLFATNELNIQRINNHSVDGRLGHLEFIVTSLKKCNTQTIKGQLLELSSQHHTDIAFLEDNVYRRNKRLIVFDMDSTLIQTEVVDELAELCGVGDKVKAVTERAMNGEIEFNQSLRERVSYFEGLEESVLENVAKSLPITSGVEDFLNTVKQLGYKVAIVSGGFTYFANYLKRKLGLDYAFANQLEIIDGKLTGKVIEPIINAEQKAIILEMLAQQEKINLEQVVAIGDGANDLQMLAKAGLGIAFHAKEVVKKSADHTMSHGPMTSILTFLGISERDIRHLGGP
jgi:phosphoserine phosphatase